MEKEEKMSANEIAVAKAILGILIGIFFIGFAMSGFSWIYLICTPAVIYLISRKRKGD